MKKRYFIFLALFIIFFAVCLCLTLDLAAVEVAQVEPAKIRTITLPGNASTGTIKIDNQSAEPKNIKVYAEDWFYLPVCDGTKEFKPAGSTGLSAAQWITFSPAEFKLPPFGRQILNYTVRLPEDAKGGHYAVLFFESVLGEQKAASEGVSVNIAIRVASLFYIEPQGTIVRQAKIDNLQVSSQGNNNIAISVDFANTGNVDITAEADFSIIDNRGMVYARGKFNNVYTLPGDRTKLTSNWKEPIPGGTYDLILTVNIGKALEELNLGRGPVITKEAQIQVGSNNRILMTGELK